MLPGKLRLRTLLILLSVGGVILTACLLLGSLLIFQKGNIEDSLLESNIAYARKLADTTDRYLTTAQRELVWSAGQIKGLTIRGTFGTRPIACGCSRAFSIPSWWLTATPLSPRPRRKA